MGPLGRARSRARGRTRRHGDGIARSRRRERGSSLTRGERRRGPPERHPVGCRTGRDILRRGRGPRCGPARATRSGYAPDELRRGLGRPKDGVGRAPGARRRVGYRRALRRDRGHHGGRRRDETLPLAARRHRVDQRQERAPRRRARPTGVGREARRAADLRDSLPLHLRGVLQPHGQRALFWSRQPSGARSLDGDERNPWG
jgi:hypothetical protein